MALEFAGTERFQIVRRLGAGGMGVVYEAYDRERRDSVALKVLLRSDPVSLLRFKNEFRTLAHITHRHLVPLYELIATGDSWFFTMQLLRGVNWLTYCWETVPDGSDDDRTVAAAPLDVGGYDGPRAEAKWERIRSTFRQLADGLSALHTAGKLHQDVKPSNVMVEPGGHVVLLDYGLIGELGDTSYWVDGVFGTPAYMAPEHGDGRLTPSSDWYSAGLMLYEALTGTRPFGGSAIEMLEQRRTAAPVPPSRLVPAIPADLDQLCVDLLRPLPRDRAHGRDVLERLWLPGRVHPRVPATTPPRSRFVGRSQQLSALRRAYLRMEGGHCVCARVEGESGVGKTALVRRFLRRLARTRGGVVLTGRCYEGESIPFKGIDSLVDALARYLVRLPRDEAEAIMPRHAAALAQMFPVLQRVGVFAASLRPTATLGDAGASRHRAFAALRELLARLGDRRPLVLHIDDLQWGDVDSAALLSEVLRAPDPPCLLLIASFRSEHADINPCLQVLDAAAADAPSQWLRIEVPPLDDADAHRMAEVLLGETAAADPARIAKEAGGNPYFISELARAASSAGQAPHAASPDVESVVLARVDALPPRARRLLDVIALAGRPLRLRHACEAVDSDQFSQTALRLLRTERLVRTTRLALDDWLETYHDRVREAVVRRLPADTMRTLHWRLALTLESAPGTDPEAIAEHFAAAGERSRAGVYFARAADAAAQALAFDRAAALYRAALDALDGASTQARRLRIDLAAALANAGRGLDAARAYEAASDDWTGDEALDLWRQAATQYCISGHLVEGRRIFERLLRRFGMSLPSTPRATFSALALRRAQLRLRGVAFRERTPEQILPEDLRRIDMLWSVAAGLSLPDPLGVAALQTRGLILALRVGEPYRIARALAVETYLTAAGGWPDAARASRLLETTTRVAERLGHPHAIGLARLAAGVTALWQMRFADTVRACEDALAILTERCTGVWWERATAQTIIAWALWHMGQLGELAERTAGYVKEARERGDLLLLTSLGTIVAPHLHLAADRPDRALHELDETVAQLPGQGFHTQHMEAVFSRAHIHLYLGQAHSAVDLIDRSWPVMRRALQLRPQIIRLMMLDLRARAAVAAAAADGDASRLLRAAARDAARLAKEQSPHAPTFSASIMASVAAAGGDRVRATALLRDAADGFDRADLSLRAACTRRRLGELIGGDEGIALVTGAEAEMRRQRVVDPARTAALYAGRS